MRVGSRDRLTARFPRLIGGMHLRHWMIFAALATAGCTLDLWTKHWIFTRLGHHQLEGLPSQSPWILVDGVFSFETHLNEGALFGIGQRRITLFVSLSLVAIAGIFVWMIWGGAAQDRLLTVSLGLVLGGILGNLYDRLGFPSLVWASGVPGHEAGEPVYAVRDWLHFQIESIGFDWAIFNIADSLLVVGAVLLLAHALWFGQAPDGVRESASDTATSPEVAEATSLAASELEASGS